VYKQTLRNVKLTPGKKGKKTELTGKGPLRRRRSALDCSATEEEEKETITNSIGDLACLRLYLNAVVKRTVSITPWNRIEIIETVTQSK
jgi:hypothetical protein